jgi:hypothetical protein
VNWPGVLSLFVLMLAVVGVFIDIPVVSNYAFWFAIAAYIMRDWTFRSLVWPGILSLVVLGLSVVGVFMEIPFVTLFGSRSLPISFVL